MTNEEIITALAQDIYLVKNDVLNDVTGTELTDFLAQTIMYANQWIEEVEAEADWNWSRTNDFTLGTIASPTGRTIPITDATVRTLVTSPYRPLTISQDGTIISTFQVVNPNQIGNPADPETRDRATVIGRNIILSRDLTDEEVGGTVKADVIDFLPKIATDYSDISVLSLIQPRQLMVLGVAKNSTLPNVIQGQLSPSYVQKYNDLLTKTIAANNNTSENYDAQSEDFSFIGGLY